MDPSSATTPYSVPQHTPTPADSQHDFYAWCMFALVATLLVEMMGTVAFAHLVLPSGHDHAYSHLYFNVASGVFAVVTLFSIFVSEHGRVESRAYAQRLEKLEQESASGSRIIDQDTNTFTREYFDRVLLRETGRGSVSSKSFCVLQCALSHTGLGAEKDVVFSYLEAALSQILRNNLRACDVVAHTAKGEFIVLLPEMNEHLAQIPLERIRDAAEHWNLNSSLRYRMRIKLGLCEHDKNSSTQDLLLRLSQRCQLDQYVMGTLGRQISPAPMAAHANTENPRHVC